MSWRCERVPSCSETPHQWSCKPTCSCVRGFCPSCGARRMAEAATHLVDEVFPKKPMRQWVLTFPFELRFLFAREPKIMGEVLSLVNKTLSTFLIKTGLTRKSGARTGSVTFIQRFGGSLNLNIHFHMMFPQGVYSFENGRSKFHLTNPPSTRELDKLLISLAHRVVRFLEKQGLIQRDEDQAFLSQDSDPSAMDQVSFSSITYRIALGKHKGQKTLTLKTLSETNHGETKPFLSKYSGFSLHAGVSTKAHQREKLERICRYISRPSLSEQRLSVNSQGKIIYQLKTPYENGTTRIILDPLDFLSRLASLVPRPRTNLIRFHGVFAPNFKYRHLITPKTKSLGKQTTQPGNSSSMTWARRLKRTFGMDIEICPECGGKLKVISSIEDLKIIYSKLFSF